MSDPTYRVKIEVERSDLNYSLKVTMDEIPAAKAEAPGWPLASVIASYLHFRPSIEEESEPQ